MDGGSGSDAASFDGVGVDERAAVEDELLHGNGKVLGHLNLFLDVENGLVSFESSDLELLANNSLDLDEHVFFALFK